MSVSTRGVEEPSSGLAEFEALNARQGSHCQWPAAISLLSGQDRASLDAAMLAPHIQHTAIVRWLAMRNVDTNKTTVARHRPRRNGEAMECLTCRA